MTAPFVVDLDDDEPEPGVDPALRQARHRLLVDILRRHSPAVERLQDRYARWRRETWWRNEMGDKQSHFKPAEQFRR